MRNQPSGGFAPPIRFNAVIGKSRFFSAAFRFSSRIFGQDSEIEKTLITVCRWILAAVIPVCFFIPRFSFVVFSFQLDLRAEDVMLLTVVLLMLPVVSSEEKRVEIPGLQTAMLAYLVILQLSILFGTVLGLVEKPILSLFYLLKWTEYFLLFWLTFQTAMLEPLKSKADGERKPFQESLPFFIRVFFLSGLGVAAYGYAEHFLNRTGLPAPYFRLYERFPFHGDANHIGAFLVLWSGFFGGLFLMTNSKLRKLGYFAALMFVFSPLVWTYSIKSYLAAAGAFFAATGLIRKGWKSFAFVSIFSIIIFSLPEFHLWDRVYNLLKRFDSSDPFASSFANNVYMWRRAFWNFDKFFLLGSGLGSRHRFFYESQYVLILAETGIAGTAAFFYLCKTLMSQVWGHLKSPEDSGRGMALGWMMGFIGLLIHSTSCVSFTVVKIAFPFWFLTAAVFAYFQGKSFQPAPDLIESWPAYKKETP